MLKPEVQKAVYRLRDELVRRDANPFQIIFPRVSGLRKVGADDFLVHHGAGAADAIRALYKRPLFIPEGITGEALSLQVYTELPFIVPRLIPVGLTIFAGMPKTGKSWLVLAIVLAAAAGKTALGRYDVPQMEALYLALEDTPRRLKQRIEQIFTGQPNRFSTFHTEWPKIEDDGLRALETYLDQHPGIRLVVIDTLAKMRKAPTTRGSIYNEDYEAIVPLKQIADQRGIAIVLVHHLRKGQADDPMERISGSTGLTGAADTLIVLDRKGGSFNAVLHIRGRDIEDQNLALQFDQGCWTIIGDATEVGATSLQEDILEYLHEAEEPCGPTEIGRGVGRQAGGLMKTLRRMVRDGRLHTPQKGKYAPASTTNDKFKA